jgi:nitrite reductase/ring-hydroxylating ferredoxin subunit/uncharacterized membrane protein
MLKEFLQGKPFRHPVHTYLVHFPIGLFVLSFLLDLGSLIFPSLPGLVPGAFYTMLVGVICALIAAIPGFVDYNDIRRDHPARKIATVHMTLNLIAVALYAVNLGLRSGSLSESSVPLAPFVLTLAGLSLLGISGYLGGYMVYDDGVGVGRHRRRTAAPEETIRMSTADAPAAERNQEWVFMPVASAGALHEGESLRVDIDGQVIAITRIAGEVYAFQEFCSHRFGPLSEGALADGRVECPWHRSCFDVRTGKVLHGPAKVDLKTYPVEVRGDKIYVGTARNSGE